MKENRILLGLLALGAFLAPWAGGQIVAGDPIIDPGSPFGAIFLAGGAATLSHALIGLFSAIVFLLMMRRQVVQVPRVALTTSLGLWCFFLLGSVTVSDFRFDSFRTFIQFFLYAIAFFATVAAAGRQAGPKAILTAIFAGTALSALMGLSEYGSMKAIDPNWRIFANWNNPNAAAAMLLVGFILGIGLTMSSERVIALLIGFVTVLIGLALVLTGSKGALALGLPIALAALGAGLAKTPKGGWVGALGTIVVLGVSGVLFLKGLLWLAVPLGAVALVLFGTALSAADRPLVTAARPLVILIGLAGMIGLLQVQAKQPTPNGVTHTAPLNRLSNAAQTQDQSAEFRLNLWKSAIQLAKEEPYGIGLAAFQYDSGRPGLATQTVLAHNVYLQLLAEISLPGLLAFLAFGLVWLVHVHRGATGLPAERRLLRSTVVAAVLGLMVHSAVDSNLYYFGLGYVLFVLLGVGLLLSGDAVAPEFVPAPLRGVAVLLTLGIVFTSLMMGVAEFSKGTARAYLEGKQMPQAQAAAESAASMTPNDPDVWVLKAYFARSPEEQMEDLKAACALGPSTKNLRALAAMQAAAGRNVDAMGSLNAALKRDPANLPALQRLSDVQFANGATEDARNTLRRLIAVEELPVFKVRSQPDLIATETYEARLALARATNGIQERRDLLKPAVEGYLRYASVSIPIVYRNATTPQPGFDTVAKAQTKLAMAVEAARLLEAASRTLRDQQSIDLAQTALQEFQKAIGDAPAANPAP